MGGGADSQTMAELKAQNDKLRANQVINRNLLKAQNKRMDKLEQQMVVDEMTSTVNNGLKSVSDAVLKECNVWLDHQHARWQRVCGDAFRACFLTDQNYNKVMSALPKPSILEAVVKGLITGLAAIQPEFAMFAVVLQLGMPGEKEVREKRLETLAGMKELFKEAFEKGKEAFEKGEQMERHESQLDAKLKFFQDQMESCSETSSWITECYAASKYVLARATVENAVPVTVGVRKGWTIAVGEARPYHHGDDTQLSLLFLYDLLRAYCKQSVKVCADFGVIKTPLSRAKAIQMVNDDDGAVIQFDGLDAAKRKVMYELFERIQKLGPKRPEITNYKDLILNWEFAN